MIIAILEDDERRQAAMRDALRQHDPACDPVFFDNAPDMVEWLHDHLDDIGLVCLDHDLGPSRERGGVRFEPGTGRDVSRFLAGVAPRCGVVVHSSNPDGAPAMVWELEAAGWSVRRVIPFGDLEWIATSWIERLVEALSLEAVPAETPEPEINRWDTPSIPGAIRYVRENLAVCGYAGIGRRETFASHGFRGHLQCAAPFDDWIPEVCDVLAVPFLDCLPIPPEAFDRAKEWFLPKWGAGEKVLVSCAGGSSRSVSMATALLATAERISFRAALSEVLAAIPGAYPHPVTLVSASRLAGENLTIENLRQIYDEIEHKPPYPWSDELLDAATGWDLDRIIAVTEL